MSTDERANAFITFFKSNFIVIIGFEVESLFLALLSLLFVIIVAKFV